MGKFNKVDAMFDNLIGEFDRVIGNFGRITGLLDSEIEKLNKMIE